MIVKVTQEHIDTGNRGSRSPESCPVALAMKDAGMHYPWVDSEYISFFDAEAHQEPTPPLVALFIMDFDAGEPVEPFEFELEAETEVNE